MLLLWNTVLWGSMGIGMGASSTRYDQAVFQYDFTRSDCLNNSIHDASGGGNILGEVYNTAGSDTHHSSCLLSNGLQSPTSSSTSGDDDGYNSLWSSAYNITFLKNQVGEKDFSIELWFQPAVNNPLDSTIFSFELPPDLLPYSSYSFNSNLKVYKQFHNLLQIISQFNY